MLYAGDFDRILEMSVEMIEVSARMEGVDEDDLQAVDSAMVLITEIFADHLEGAMAGDVEIAEDRLRSRLVMR